MLWGIIWILQAPPALAQDVPAPIVEPTPAPTTPLPPLPEPDGKLERPTESGTALWASKNTYVVLPMLTALFSLGSGLIWHWKSVQKAARLYPNGPGSWSLWMGPLLTLVASFLLLGGFVGGWWAFTNNDMDKLNIRNYGMTFFKYWSGAGIITCLIYVIGAFIGGRKQ